MRQPFVLAALAAVLLSGTAMAEPLFNRIATSTFQERVYYFNDEIPKEEDFEKAIADYLTFEFSMIMQGREYLFEK